MKKSILNIAARSYLWLPLTLICLVLPVRADLIVQTDSTSGIFHGGTFHVSGFDTSLGTLNEVDVSSSTQVTGAYTNDGSAPITISGDFRFDETLDKPDNHGMLGLGGGLFIQGTVSPGDSTSGAGSGSNSVTLTDAMDLAEFETSAVSLSFDITHSVLFLDPSDATVDFSYAENVQVTYDYTPFSATPEPATMVLLGTVATVCLWGKRKRWAPTQSAAAEDPAVAKER